jgi:hypothetical protein
MSTPARESSVDAEPSGRSLTPQGPAPAAAPSRGEEPARTPQEFTPIDELAEGLEDPGTDVPLAEHPATAPEPATPHPAHRQEEERSSTPDELGEGSQHPGAPESALQEEGAVGSAGDDLLEPDPFTLQAHLEHLEGRVSAIPREATAFVERRIGEVADAIMREARAEAVRLGQQAIARVETSRGFRRGPQLGDLVNQLGVERKARLELEGRLRQQRRELEALREENGLLRHDMDALQRQGATAAPAPRSSAEVEALWGEVDYLRDLVVDLRHWMSDMAMGRAGPSRASREEGSGDMEVPRRRPLGPASGCPTENVEEEAPETNAGRGKTSARGRGHGQRRGRPL